MTNFQSIDSPDCFGYPWIGPTASPRITCAVMRGARALKLCIVT